MNYLLDHAVAEGRIAQASRAEWAGRYLSNPAGTEATLAALTPIGAGVLGHGSDPVEQTLAAGRALLGIRHGTAAPPAAAAGEPAQAQHLRPVVEATEADLRPEQVESWTRDLFPETRAGAAQGRVTSDMQYKRVAV